MTSNHHASYVLGYTRATMAVTKGSDSVSWSRSHKGSPSSDCGLQPAHMKSELLVIPNQHVGVNAFPGLVHTARHAMGVEGARSRWANPAMGGSCLRQNRWLGWSRNKVAIRERVAGSPPFKEKWSRRNWHLCQWWRKENQENSWQNK